MKITVLKEKITGEKRVALSPASVKHLTAKGFRVFIEKNAGLTSYFTDDQYIAAGAKVSNVALELLADADILLKVQASSIDEQDELSEIRLLRSGSTVIGQLYPNKNQSLVKLYRQYNITSFSLEQMPSLAISQRMNVNFSQDNIIGYRAAIKAAYEFEGMFSSMLSSAGSIIATKILVIGMNIAGLQAISTAKKLGATIYGFEEEFEAKELIESVGGIYLDPQATDLKEILKKCDIVICAKKNGAITGNFILTKELVNSLGEKSIIIDLMFNDDAANCILSEKNKVVEYKGVKIFGCSNLASEVPQLASNLYSNNLLSFINHIVKSHKFNIDLDDEIIRTCLLTYQGKENKGD